MVNGADIGDVSNMDGLRQALRLVSAIADDDDEVFGASEAYRPKEVSRIRAAVGLTGGIAVSSALALAGEALVGETLTLAASSAIGVATGGALFVGVAVAGGIGFTALRRYRNLKGAAAK